MTDDEIIRFFQDAPDDGSDESALRIGRAIRNSVLEEVAQRFDATGRDLAAADVRALKTKEGG